MLNVHHLRVHAELRTEMLHSPRMRSRTRCAVYLLCVARGAYMKVFLALAGLVGGAAALDNGLGRTPPMGFNVRLHARH